MRWQLLVVDFLHTAQCLLHQWKQYTHACFLSGYCLLWPFAAKSSGKESVNCVSKYNVPVVFISCVSATGHFCDKSSQSIDHAAAGLYMKQCIDCWLLYVASQAAFSKYQFLFCLWLTSWGFSPLESICYLSPIFYVASSNLQHTELRSTWWDCNKSMLAIMNSVMMEYREDTEHNRPFSEHSFSTPAGFSRM